MLMKGKGADCQENPQLSVARRGRKPDSVNRRQPGFPPSQDSVLAGAGTTSAGQAPFSPSACASR